MANTGNLIPIRRLEPEGDSSSKGTSRLRSRVACRGCNHRKVRCDVTTTGIPCSNCVHEAARCEVLPRKKHRPRRDRKISQPSQSTTQSDHDSYLQPCRRTLSDPFREDGSATDRGIRDPHIDKTRTHAHSDTRSLDSQLVRVSESQRPQSLNDNPVTFRDDGSKDLPTPIDSEVALPDDSSLTYIGDKQGPRFFVYDLCYPESPQDAMPYLLPRESDISWKPHEVEYLRHQGAFDTLPDDVCDDLIRCYFHHVHFFLPVVDAASFLAEYNNNGRRSISLLLFWSMLLAAANFVEIDILRKSGFTSRKAMKVAMYQRTKALYDLDHGTDKLVLIQSVILMGFWYTDSQDHTGAWYWIGLAISLSQTLGLHRRPRLNNHGHRLPESQQPLTRRIWWSCVIRDRWLSLAKGRPLRIHDEDCDVPMPRVEDILNNLDIVPTQTRQKFIPADSEILVNMWINLVEISSSLGRILRIHYRVNGPKPAVEDINNSAVELRQCMPRELLRDTASDLLHLHAYHMELFYEATVAVLYRPYVLSKLSTTSSKAEVSLQRMALEQARAAASNTNKLLEKIIELNTVHLLKPMIITTLIPAMQIHLFDCKSMVPLRRGLGSNKLNLCMLVLSQLRETYWSASVIHRLFGRAQVMLNKSHSGISSQAEKSTINSPRMTTHSTSEATDTEHEQQHNRNQDEQQQQEDRDPPVRLMPESNLSMVEQNTPFWLDDSPFLSNVDLLLDPRFSVSENTFHSFSTGYESGMIDAYGQIGPISSDAPIDLLYHA